LPTFCGLFLGNGELHVVALAEAAELIDFIMVARDERTIRYEPF